MNRTQEEIQEQIRELKELRKTVRPTSMFGDSNIAAIDAQIQVLEEGMDYDDIDDQFDVEYTRDSATTAADWLWGDSEAVPTDDWKALVKK